MNHEPLHERAQKGALTFVTTTHPDQSKEEGYKKQVRSAAIRNHLEKNGPRRPRGLARGGRRTRLAVTNAPRPRKTLTASGGSSKADHRSIATSKCIACTAFGPNEDVRDHETPLRVVSRGVYVPNPLPWSSQWPELAVHYTSHAPDFTGIGLYDPSKRYPYDYGLLAARSPYVFTVQVLLAEAARITNRVEADRLLWLKYQSIRLINGALRDAQQRLTVDAIAAVAALTVHDLVFEDGKAAEQHIRGLSLMIELRGGMDSIEMVSIKFLVLWTDALWSYFSGNDRRLRTNTAEGEVACRVDHPLRLAIQPSESCLAPFRLRNHLLISFSGVVSELLIFLGSIDKLATAAFRSDSPGISETIYLHIAHLERQVLAIDLTSRNNRLDTAIFSSKDCTTHELILTYMRQVALILVSRFRQVLHDSADTRAVLEDRAVQTYRLGVDSELILQDNAEVFCWLMLTIAPFLNGVNAASTKAVIREVIMRMGLKTLGGARSMLSNIFYCGVLMDGPLARLWDGSMTQQVLDV